MTGPQRGVRVLYHGDTSLCVALPDTRQLLRTPAAAREATQAQRPLQPPQLLVVACRRQPTHPSSPPPIRSTHTNKPLPRPHSRGFVGAPTAHCTGGDPLKQRGYCKEGIDDALANPEQSSRMRAPLDHGREHIVGLQCSSRPCPWVRQTTALAKRKSPREVTRRTQPRFSSACRAQTAPLMDNGVLMELARHCGPRAGPLSLCGPAGLLRGSGIAVLQGEGLPQLADARHGPYPRALAKAPAKLCERQGRPLSRKPRPQQRAHCPGVALPWGRFGAAMLWHAGCPQPVLMAWGGWFSGSSCRGQARPGWTFVRSNQLLWPLVLVHNISWEERDATS